MECHPYHFSFNVLVVLICAPLAFSFWTKNKGLPIPDPGAKMTCVDWILFYGFRIDDFLYNYLMANRRDFTQDIYASTWAAIYAYRISGSFRDPLMPDKFCEERGASDGTEYPFLPLKYERRTCEDWIYLYGYSDVDINKNVDTAMDRYLLMDNYISLWADGYGQALSSSEQGIHDLLPSDYCIEMGQTSQVLMSFMYRKGTQLTCEGWIKLYGYTDNPISNFAKALEEFEKPLYPFKILKPCYTRDFSLVTRNRGKHDIPSLEVFCRDYGYDEDETDFFESEKYNDDNATIFD